MTQHRPVAPFDSIRVSADAKPVDRDLAAALEELLRSPHAHSECNDSVRPIALEALFWIGFAGMVWVTVALLS